MAAISYFTYCHGCIVHTREEAEVKVVSHACRKCKGTRKLFKGMKAGHNSSHKYQVNTPVDPLPLFTCIVEHTPAHILVHACAEEAEEGAVGHVGTAGHNGHTAVHSEMDARASRLSRSGRRTHNHKHDASAVLDQCSAL